VFPFWVTPTIDIEPFFYEAHIIRNGQYLSLTAVTSV
jgi:hypothetical protein